ncbi:MAG: putative maltokinase [Gemmatimonadaceae bacterium]
MSAILRVEGKLSQVLSAATLETIASAALLEFLGTRRWFGAKAEARAARIGHVIALPWDAPPSAIARVDVTLDDGTMQHYQLPLTVRTDDEPREKTERAVLARVESDVERGDLFDAAGDSAFRDRLGAAFARGETFASGGATWSVERVGEGADLSNARGKVIGAEQSNTSIVYGDRAILKLFRRLEPGVHPDAEASRFLTERTSFRNTPALLGLIASEANGERTIAGMLSALVPNAQDAWAYVLERARAYYNAKGDQPQNGFSIEARDLGAATRQLHDALASVSDDADFAPVAATEDDVHDWAEAAREQMERSLALLESRVATLDPMAQAAGRALLARRDALEEHVDESADAIGDDAGMLIRHHGDFHLGQVLRAGDGRWMIIDFEGEPSRALEDRRARSSPLRDVAGMLRSFAYAAATVAAELRGNSVNTKLELRSSWFERDVRRAFLDGYASPDDGARPPALLPRDADDVTRVLSLFEIEKTFYELAYELNHRPAWAWIPLRAIAKML